MIIEPMPPTDDRQPLDFRLKNSYLESDKSWCDRNVEAVTWFIDNHKAIRKAMKYVRAYSGNP